MSIYMTRHSEKKHIWNWTRLLVFFTFMMCIYLNNGEHLYECSIKNVWEKAHLEYNYQYFSLSLTFPENINQEHNFTKLCMSLCCLLMYWYVLNNVCQASLLSFLLLAIFCLGQCQMGIVCCLAQHICHWQEITNCYMNLEWQQLSSYI